MQSAFNQNISTDSLWLQDAQSAGASRRGRECCHHNNLVGRWPGLPPRAWRLWWKCLGQLLLDVEVCCFCKTIEDVCETSVGSTATKQGWWWWLIYVLVSKQKMNKMIQMFPFWFGTYTTAILFYYYGIFINIPSRISFQHNSKSLKACSRLLLFLLSAATTFLGSKSMASRFATFFIVDQHFWWLGMIISCKIDECSPTPRPPPSPTPFKQWIEYKVYERRKRIASTKNVQVLNALK